MPDRFDNLDGTWLALGAAAIVTAAGAVRRRGAANDDEPELLLPGQYRGTVDAPRPSQLPQLRRSAELAMPDTDLARRMLYGGDVLGELTFEQATVVDPRRVDALISQRIGRAFEQVFGHGADPMAEELYLAGVRFAREHHGGDLPTSAIVSLVQENLDRALFSTWPRLPGPMKAHIRANLHVFDAALDDAKKIAQRAARVTRGTDDNLEWTALAQHLEGHKPMLRAALAEGLPGPVAGRGRALPRPRRALPGPRWND